MRVDRFWLNREEKDEEEVATVFDQPVETVLSRTCGWLTMNPDVEGKQRRLAVEKMQSNMFKDTTVIRPSWMSTFAN